MFLELPDAKCKSPRDGLRPCKTEDMLFLAALLQRGGNARYFLETRDGTIIPETECVEPADVKSKINRATVRQWFWKRYYPFRRLLANGKVRGFGIRFMGQELRSDRRWKHKEPWALGKSLKWPFEKGHDPLLNDLHKIPLLSWQEIRPLKKGEVYCPLDGPVSPVEGELITPPISWKMMCGRHWRTLLCLHCLGQIQVELIRMN